MANEFCIQQTYDLLGQMHKEIMGDEHTGLLGLGGQSGRLSVCTHMDLLQSCSSLVSLQVLLAPALWVLGD